MIAETRCPPILQQPRGEPVAAGVPGFEIAVVLQDIERFLHSAGGILHDLGIPLLKATPRVRTEPVLGGCLGEDFHCDRVTIPVRQPVLEARFVVHETVLPRGTEQLCAVNFGHVVHRHAVAVLHGGEILQPCEEGLYVMRNPETECVIHGVCDTRLDR